MGQLKLTPVVRHTYADYAAIPPDLQRWELIDGEFYVSPSPNFFHQKILLRLAARFVATIEQTGPALVVPAPLDVVLSPHDTVEPDIVVVRRSRRHLIGKRGIEGAPDLLVEILSPSNKLQDRSIKRSLYEKFGVTEYWIVDPESESIEVLVLTAGKYAQHAVFRGRSVARSKLFANLQVPLRKLFAAI